MEETIHHVNLSSSSIDSEEPIIRIEVLTDKYKNFSGDDIDFILEHIDNKHMIDSDILRISLRLMSEKYNHCETVYKFEDYMELI